MAKISDVIKGLQILQKHAKDDVHIGGAEHDIIYGPDLESELTPEESARIDNELGWFFDEETSSWARFC